MKYFICSNTIKTIAVGIIKKLLPNSLDHDKVVYVDFIGENMKILPVFFSHKRFSSKGNDKIGFNQGMVKLDYNNQKDVFTRLAIASTRDKKIEQELKDMKLI